MAGKARKTCAARIGADGAGKRCLCRAAKARFGAERRAAGRAFQAERYLRRFGRHTQRAGDHPARRFRRIKPREKPIRVGGEVKREPRRARRIQPRDRHIARKPRRLQHCLAFRRKLKALAENPLSNSDFRNRQTVNPNAQGQMRQGWQ